MEQSNLSKTEKQVADLLHYELSNKFSITYEECLDLAKKIYDKYWW